MSDYISAKKQAELLKKYGIRILHIPHELKMTKEEFEEFLKILTDNFDEILEGEEE